MNRYAVIPAGTPQSELDAWQADCLKIESASGVVLPWFYGITENLVEARAYVVRGGRGREDDAVAAALIRLQQVVPGAVAWSTDQELTIYTPDWQRGSEILEQLGME